MLDLPMPGGPQIIVLSFTPLRTKVPRNVVSSAGFMHPLLAACTKHMCYDVRCAAIVAASPIRKTVDCPRSHWCVGGWLLRSTDPAHEWAHSRLTTIGESCRALLRETLGKTFARVVE